MQWLLDVGHGRNLDKDLKINIPLSMVTFDKDELINRIYASIENIKSIPPPLDYFLYHAILAPQNVDVQDTKKKSFIKCQLMKLFVTVLTL